MRSATKNNQLIIADAHVHIYECFNLEQLLNAASDNFKIFAGQQGYQDNFTPVLFLTETIKDKFFQQFFDGVDINPKCRGINLNDWKLKWTQESLSLYAFNKLGQGIFLIAGRQVVTAENLEILALITDQTFADGLSLEATIKSILAAGGIPVLPWGFGKWMGKRGKFLHNFLEESNFPSLFLGDNGGRPIFWPRPSHFKQAEKKGLRILPGTDPLPLASEYCRPGSFGFTIEGELSLEEPGKQIKKMLLDSTISIQAYGSLETPWRFIRNQLAIRYGSENKQTKVNRQVVSTSNFPETADIETASEDYASRFSGSIGTWLLQVQEQATLEMLAAYPQATVLDVGGGHGQLTKPLIDGGYQVTVVGSDSSCQQRIQTYLDRGLCSFQVGNVLDLPYPDDAFDVVVCYRFLAHVTHWQAFLTELARVAKWAVIVDYPTQRSINAIAPYLFKFKKGVEKNTRPFICYREEELLEFLAGLQLRPEARYPQFCLPMVIHRLSKTPQLSALSERVLRGLGLTNLFGSPVILKLTKNNR